HRARECDFRVLRVANENAHQAIESRWALLRIRKSKRLRQWRKQQRLCDKAVDILAAQAIVPLVLKNSQAAVARRYDGDVERPPAQVKHHPTLVARRR